MAETTDPLDSLPRHFSVSDALSRGVAPGRLRSARTVASFTGIRSFEPPDGTLRARCEAYLPRLADHQFFSHETALHLVGAPMPEWPYAPSVHVSSHRPAREPRTRGVVGHRLQTREPATRVLADALVVEHPARAWRQCGSLWRFDDLVAAADFLVSGQAPLVDAEDLRGEIAVMGDVRGGILRRALREVRAGVRSARETRLRLLLVRAGLPHPEVAFELFDARGLFVGELDLAYPAYRVAVEYDGRVHAEDVAQFRRDADRWDAIRGAGWQHERVLDHHLRDGGGAAVRKVREALIAAGWTPRR